MLVWMISYASLKHLYPNPVCWDIIISQSIICEKWVSVFKVKVTVTGFQFIQSNMTISVICSELLIFWGGDQHSLTVHVHKLELYCKKVALLYSRSRSQWRFWNSVHVCLDNISDRSNLVWWCIIISQSIIQKYHFAMFKVKATIVSTRSSEILKLLQSKLVWWDIITRQGKTQWKDFLAFTQGMRQRIWLRGLWTRLLPLLAIPVSKAWVSTGSNPENVERTLLL